MHVVVSPLRRPWRAARSASHVTQWLKDRPDVAFFLCGRSSAGRGQRDISRTLSPNRLVVVVDWTHDADVDASAGRTAFDDGMRATGASVWSASLVPVDVRGEWNGATPFTATTNAHHGAVASLTCARIRPPRMVDFYLRSFPALAKEARRAGSSMIAGLGFGGAIPLRDAFTISFWPTSSDVTAYAFRDSAHDEVQRRSTTEGWMSQSLFVRFAVADHGGTWSGGDPLLETTAP